MFVSLNGEFLNKETATAPVFHSGLYYGTGCFETIRAESGNLLFFDEHYNRLKAGLTYLGAKESDLPDQQILLNNSIELLKLNGVEEKLSKVRIQCTIAERNGYAIDDDSNIYTLITAEIYRSTENPKVLTVAKTRVIPQSCRPSSLKLCNMLHYRNAFREAQNVGADDSVMLSTAGFISETSIANLFWKTGNWIYTPSAKCDCLPGIARNNVIKSVLKSTEFKLIEGEFELENLMEADSVWVTNSLIEIHPVKRINQHEFVVDSQLTSRLLREYRSLKNYFNGS